MLIADTLERTIRYLLNNRGEKVTVRDVAAATDTSTSRAMKNLNKLKAAGYFKNKQVRRWEDLLQAWAYTQRIQEHETVAFSAAERPQYVMRKIADALQEGVEYAFTLYSATELVAPYVSPGSTALYILPEDRETVEERFEAVNVFPAEEGNVKCFLADEHHLYNAETVKNMSVVSLPQLYVDLHSLGGRGVDAAEHVLRVMPHV